MWSKKAVTILCSSIFIFLLTISEGVAGTPSQSETSKLPPAIAMLKNLKKSATDRPIIKPVAKQKNTPSSVKKKIAKQRVSKPEKTIKQIMKTAPVPVIPPAVKLADAGKQTNAASPPAIQKKKEVVQPEAKPIVQSENEASVEALPETPIIHPDLVQFSEEDLQKRHDEIALQFAADKEKEAVEAAAAAKYYEEHEQEIKMQQIAAALANHMPAKKTDEDASSPSIVNPPPVEQAIASNIIPVKGKQIKLKEKKKQQENERAVYEKLDQTNLLSGKKSVLVKTKLAAQIKNAAKKEPVKQVEPATSEDVKAPDYAFLPEGAQIVAGNPYEDEFFIVGKNSPKKLKQLAEAAKHVEYVPPVMIAANKKESRENAMTALIKKVASKVTHTAKYVSDPFVHYLTAKKLAANKPRVKSSVITTPLSKPQFAADKIATRVFNSSMSEEKETDEVTRLVDQLQAKHKQDSPKKVAVNQKAKRKVKKITKLVASKKSLRKLSSRQSQIAAVEKKAAVTDVFKPVVKHYADMIAKKRTVVAKKAGKSIARKQIAAKNSRQSVAKKQMVAKKKPKIEFIVRPYEKAIHQPRVAAQVHIAGYRDSKILRTQAKKPRVKVARKGLRKKQVHVANKAPKRPVQMSHNADRLPEHFPGRFPDKLPNYLPETF